jgi:flagellar protein FlaG
MSLEVTRVLPQQTQYRYLSAQKSNKAAKEPQPILSEQEIEQYAKDIQKLSHVFDKRLSVRYHKELGQFVIKIIDAETDTVIKEVPPQELQKVHLRIREAIGLLLDKTA